jgi:aspartyl-tRNA(Asn)/glutamyl-tRNA(Gln) amidotransferase subunit B
VYGLPAYDARIITDDKALAEYFNELLAVTKNYKAAANWILGPVKNYLNENGTEIKDFKIAPVMLSKLIALIDEGKTNFAVASAKIFPVLATGSDREPLQIAQEMDLIQNSDEGQLIQLVNEAISKYPEKVMEYKGGKKGVAQLFVGEVMKLSKGKADPKIASKLVMEKLDA